MAQFSNQSVSITGASGGLGRQLAIDFAKRGAKVALNYATSRDKAEGVASMIRDGGGEALVIGADISQSRDVNKMVETVESAFGGIDILVNNAGLSQDAPFLDISEEAWDRVCDVNLKGPFLVSQAVGRLMVAARQGRIVNISATSAIVARTGNANYAASKAGLNMLTQVMALELGPCVTVNAVALGFVDSDLLRVLFSANDIEQIEQSLPLERLTTFAETSAFVQMLASGAASYVTGQVIPFDGGRVMR